MKIINTIVLAAFLSTAAIASSPQEMKAEISRRADKIEKNIVANLNSGIADVQANTMQLIIDLSKTNTNVNLGETVIPLLRILKSDARPELRVYSALALYHLKSNLGKFAVEQRMVYDDDPRVNKVCSLLIHNWNEKTNPGDAFGYTTVPGF